MRQQNAPVACMLSCLLVLNVLASASLVKQRAISFGDTAVLESSNVGFELASTRDVLSGQRKLLTSDSVPNITSAVDDYLLR
jgi:hypothetical protein